MLWHRFANARININGLLTVVVHLFVCVCVCVCATPRSPSLTFNRAWLFCHSFWACIRQTRATRDEVCESQCITALQHTSQFSNGRLLCLFFFFASLALFCSLQCFLYVLQVSFATNDYNRSPSELRPTNNDNSKRGTHSECINEKKTLHLIFLGRCEIRAAVSSIAAHSDS